MTDSLLGLFDKDKSGEICFSEFGALWRYVVDWQNCFKAFDKYLHFLTCRVLIYKCLQSARFAQEEMKNKRCFPQGQVRNDKPIWVARSPHHFRLQPESSGAQTVKSQQFTWKSLRLCVLRGVFRCFLRCTVSCYASLTEPVETLCASTTSSSVVLSCRFLALWQSMEGRGLGSDY